METILLAHLETLVQAVDNARGDKAQAMQAAYDIVNYINTECRAAVDQARECQAFLQAAN